MSDNRVAAMGKIKASIDGFEFDIPQEDINRMAGEDVQLDEAAAVQSNKDLIEAQRVAQAQIKTDSDIQRLEEAKRKATSQAVKDELQTEIQNARLAKAEQAAAKREEEEHPPSPKDFLQQKAQSGYQKGRDTVGKIMDAGKQVWDSLARGITPGSIYLPVGVLLVFFFLLLPENGHTRAQWLWLALVGDAEISGSTNGSFLNQFPQAQVTPVPVGQASSAALNAVIATQGNVEQPARFTGVQEP
jgi:hypothetical protein